MLQVTLDQSSILCFATFEFKLFFCLRSLNLTLLIMKLSEIYWIWNSEITSLSKVLIFFFSSKTTFNWIITSSLPFFFCPTGFKKENKNYSFPQRWQTTFVQVLNTLVFITSHRSPALYMAFLLPATILSILQNIPFIIINTKIPSPFP